MTSGGTYDVPIRDDPVPAGSASSAGSPASPGSTPVTLRPALAELDRQAAPGADLARRRHVRRRRPSTYQVPLVLRAEPVEQLAHAFIGSRRRRRRAGDLGLRRPARQGGHRLLARRRSPTQRADRRRRASSGRRRPRRSRSTSPAWRCPAEQSNTSLVFGDDAIMKLFRRLRAGPQPRHRDPRRAGQARRPAPGPAARLRRRPTIDGEPWRLAMLQEFMTTPPTAGSWPRPASAT